MKYYNETRTHLFLDKDSPLSRIVERVGRIRCRPVLGGLHINMSGFDLRQAQQFGFCRLADDSPKLSGDAIEHGSLLPHALGQFIDPAGDGRDDLLLLPDRSVVEALRDPSLIKTKIASQGRRRPAQIVRRERLQAK
jgi:hypothetical protein